MLSCKALAPRFVASSGVLSVTFTVGTAATSASIGVMEVSQLGQLKASASPLFLAAVHPGCLDPQGAPCAYHVRERNASNTNHHVDKKFREVGGRLGQGTYRVSMRGGRLNIYRLNTTGARHEPLPAPYPHATSPSPR